MKKSFSYLPLALALMGGMAACQRSGDAIRLEPLGDSLTVVRVDNPARYLLLPIQESSPEGLVKLDKGDPADMAMDVRLAVDSVDYYVPFELSATDGEAKVVIDGVPSDAICWSRLAVSDTFDTRNTDLYRPIYHHTPLYGWMNDANGLVYKDGEYHLYFQYNPYGSMWGNMHWGHSVSRDLVRWEPLPPAIARDTLGHIFSGCSVVDHLNSAGYGENALIAFYTSASDRNGQIQCMAYSTDNGRTFTKYENNPVLTPFDGLRDFRDPKVFWYEPEQKWYMIVSADKEMRFYASANLKDWEYLSGFGEGYGAQPNQFECPDFIQLPVDGNADRKKWVMIVNVNPGGPFGGSATEYFVGDFDGKTFTCDSKPQVAKWLDFGKDHYATVCFSNTGERVVAMPWMSNWQYANITPIRQYRGANGLPRELSLYSKDGEIYMAADAVDELQSLRKETRELGDLTVDGSYLVNEILPDNEGAYELEMTVVPDKSGIAGLELANSKGERTMVYLDLVAKRVVMDRTESGLTAFGERATPHVKENHDRRKTTAVNYVNDFALGTWAPLSLCEGKAYRLHLFVDKCSMELFVDDGRVAMTNLIFPTEVYNQLRLYTEGGTAQVKGLKIHRLAI